MNIRTFIQICALAYAGSSCATEIVVVGHPSAAPITKSQVVELYLGKSQDRVIFDQSDSSAIYSEFYKKAADKEVPQVKAVWSRIVFTGKALAPKQLPDSAAVKKEVAANPKAVGYIERSNVDASVKVLLTIE